MPQDAIKTVYSTDATKASNEYCDFALSKTLRSIFPVLTCIFLLPKIYVERSEAPRINYLFLQWMSTHALSHLAFGVNEFPSDVPLAFFALPHSLHLVVALSPRPPPTERLSLHENIFFPAPVPLSSIEGHPGKSNSSGEAATEGISLQRRAQLCSFTQFG